MITQDVNGIITVEWVSGDPVHGSSADPFRLDDLLVFGLTKQGTQYYSIYPIYIQGVNTYFLIQDESLEFNQDIDAYDVNGNNINIEINNSILKGSGSEHHCQLTGNIAITDSTFNNFNYFITSGVITKNANLTRVKLIDCASAKMSANSYIDIDGLDVINGGFRPHSGFNSAKNIRLINLNYGLSTLYVNGDIQNLEFINCNYDLLVLPYNGIHTINLIDSIINETKYLINIYSGEHNFSYVNLKSTFKISLQEAAGATVQLLDKDGNEIYTTTYTSDIEQLITYYQQIVETEPGVILRDDKTYYQPFTLKATKQGKQDLIISGIEVTPGQLTILRGEMVDTIPPVYYQEMFEGDITVTEFEGELITTTEFEGELITVTEFEGDPIL